MHNRAAIDRDRHRWMTCVGAAALTVALGGTAAADPREIIGNWVLASDDSPIIDVEHAGLTHDDATGVTRVNDLTVTIALDEIARGLMASIGEDADGDGQFDDSISYVIAFPTVAFTNLTHADGYFAADAIAAETMQLQTRITDDGDQHVFTVDYEGLSATMLQWAELPAVEDDADRPLSRFVPLLRAAVDFSFEEMVIASAVSRSDIPEEDVTITQVVGETRLAGAVNGDIAELSVASIEMSVEGDDDVDITMGRIEARDYNYGGSIDILLGDRQVMNYAPAVGEMRMADIAFSVPEEDFSMTIDAIRIDDIGIRSPSVPVLPYVDQIIVAAMADDDFEPDEQEFVRFIGAIYGAMRLGRFEVSGIAFNAPEIDRGDIGAFGLRDLSASGLGSLFMRGLDIAGEDDVEVRYDDFEIRDVTFPDLAALIDMERAIEEQDIATILAAVPTIGRIENSGVVMRIPEDDVDVSLGASVVEMADHIGPIPTRILFDVDRLQLDVDQLDAEAREPLEAMGYERIVLSAELEARWQADTSDLELRAETELRDGGRLFAHGTIGNVQRLAFERPDQTGLMSLLGATFENLDVRFEDDSIIARGFELAGSAQGVEGAAMQARALAMVPVVLSELGDAALAATATEAVTALVEDGAPLTIAITAPVPLPIVAIAASFESNPASILEALEIEVSNP